MNQDSLSVAVLAGGDSTRFGSPKALALFHGQPLISHMISVATALSSRIIVVVSNSEQEDIIRPLAPDAEIVSDPVNSTRSALNGALTAFEYASTRHTLLLPVDTPLVSKGLLQTLIQLRDEHGAIIPCWPNGYIEPLHGVYLTEHAYARGLDVMNSEKRRMKDLLDALTNVLYVSTEVLKRFDSDLNSFINVNSPSDLNRLEQL